jgi:hypothetical protein
MARGARRDERARRGRTPDVVGANLGDDTDAATEQARIKRPRACRCGDTTADVVTIFVEVSRDKITTRRE